MSPSTYEELNELLHRLNSEKANIEKQIEDNMMQIYEARSYTLEILNCEEEDFKVFSPRKIEDIYRDELEKSNVKQADCQKRNQGLIAEREKLDSIISVLEKVSEEISGQFTTDNFQNDLQEDNQIQDSEQSSDSIADENISISSDAKDTINKSIKNLNYLMRKIEVSTKFIRQDPMRTKLELDAVNKGIKKVTDKLNVLTE